MSGKYAMKPLSNPSSMLILNMKHSKIAEGRNVRLGCYLKTFHCHHLVRSREHPLHNLQNGSQQENSVEQSLRKCIHKVISYGTVLLLAALI
jgi:hypothetical protein